MWEWLKEFKRHGAVWLHNGDPKTPHALLTSGLHSDGFVNATEVTCRTDFVEEVLQSPTGLRPHWEEAKGVDWVVGSALGAITFAHAVASQIACRSGFTEKDEDRMVLARFPIKREEKVLLVEDVITTGGSTLKTLAAVRETGATVLPFLIALVNRSGRTELLAEDGTRMEIRALLTLDIQNWKPAECPLCRGGSPALRPKVHWAELMAHCK